MSEWEIFWAGFASGFMLGVGVAILLPWYARRVERRVLDDVQRDRQKR